MCSLLSIDNRVARQRSYSSMTSVVHPQGNTPLQSTKSLLSSKVDSLPSPATYKKPRRHRSCYCTVVARLCTILLILFFLLGAATLIAWLVLRPIHGPEYSLDDLQLKSLTVSPQSTLNANFVYMVTANNRNERIGILYDVITIDTSYDGQVFGHSMVPAFYQGYRNVTSLSSNLIVRNCRLAPSLGNALTKDLQNGFIPLQSHASAKVRVTIGALTSYAMKLYVDCDLRVSAPTSSSPGRVISKTCRQRK